MKKRPFFLTLLLFSLLSFYCSAQNTYVPDDNFEQALIDLGYDSGELNDSVPTTNIASVLTLNINQENISDITGLQDFTSLENLYCSDNNLDSLNLSMFPNLFLLECFNNQIQHLDVSQNIFLADIQCSANSLVQLNLENNPNLNSISCNANQIQTITFNGNCIATEINCAYNMIEDLNTSQLANLQYIDCSYNQIISLDFSGNPQLIQLKCNDNNLTSLDLRNGNSSQLGSFSALNNPNLYCIEIDDLSTAKSNEIWEKDEMAEYSEDCSNSQSVIPISEYNSLINLYNSTVGPNWTNNTNWLDTVNVSINDWYGITVQEGHVTEINLSHNNLQEAIFFEEVNLPELRVLNISNNLLEDADFTKLDSFAYLSEVHVENNKLVFRHVRQLLDLPYAPSVTYSPQAKVGVAKTIELEEGELLEIDFSPYYYSADDQFQWYKDGVPIQGAQTDLFDISKVNETDSGVYTLKITNSNVSGLTLESQEISVNVKASSNLVGGVPKEEYQALVDLYNATNGANWKNKSTWLDTINFSVSDWDGIEVEDGHITMILLYDNNLNGYLPSSLAQLTYLTNINFERNSIGKLPQNGARQIRVIPDELGNLENLIQLSLGYNYIQFNDLEAISGWPNFENIYSFSYNYQNGINNQIGKETDPGATVNISLQNYFRAPSDQYQWVKDNDPIPEANDSVFIIKNVQLADEANYYCILSNLKFPGMQITNYGTQLKVNDIHGAGVPFSEYKALEALYNSTNGYNWRMNTNWLDTINSTVAEWAGVVVRDGHVVGIQLDSNNVVGILPAELYNLTYLEDLALAHNQMLSGTLSAKIAQLKNLEILSLSGCSLSGTLPSQLEELDKLTHLYLAYNQFSGEIPTSLAQCLSLKFIQLKNNQLSGEIPTQLGELNLLEIIDLSNNQFSGTIPSALANLSHLRIFNLSNNQLLGPIPAELSQLEDITRFDISGNRFGATSETKSADKINTTDNRQLPDDLGNLLTSMDTLLLGGNSLQFNDIEAIYSWPNFNGLNQFKYSPQNKIGYSKTINEEEGNSVTLSIDNYFPGESDTYKWYKNDELINDASSSILEINDAIQADAGVYFCEVSNTVANQLLLTSYEINLTITPKQTIGGVLENDYSSLVNLTNYYPETDFGNNWLNTTNFDVDDWEGVTVKDRQVVALDLSNRGLQGEVYNIFAAFDSLEWVNLSGNNLYGPFPSFSGEKSKNTYSIEENAYNLSYLNIANNRFFFSDLEPVADELLAIDTFIYSPQQFIGIAVDTFVFKDSDHTIVIDSYTAGENDQYSWFKNDTLLNVFDANLSIPAVSYQDSGIYRLSVQNSIFSDLTLNSFSYKLGVKIPLNTPIVESGKLQIFPNPAENKIFVETNGRQINLVILNIHGEKLQEFRNISSKEIDISNYSKGIYFFRVKFKEQIKTKKIIIQ